MIFFRGCITLINRGELTARNINTDIKWSSVMKRESVYRWIKVVDMHACSAGNEAESLQQDYRRLNTSGR